MYIWNVHLPCRFVFVVQHRHSTGKAILCIARLTDSGRQFILYSILGSRISDRSYRLFLFYMWIACNIFPFSVKTINVLCSALSAFPSTLNTYESVSASVYAGCWLRVYALMLHGLDVDIVIDVVNDSGGIHNLPFCPFSTDLFIFCINRLRQWNCFNAISCSRRRHCLKKYQILFSHTYVYLVRNMNSTRARSTILYCSCLKFALSMLCRWSFFRAFLLGFFIVVLTKLRYRALKFTRTPLSPD